MFLYFHQHLWFQCHGPSPVCYVLSASIQIPLLFHYSIIRCFCPLWKNRFGPHSVREHLCLNLYFTPLLPSDTRKDILWRCKVNTVFFPSLHWRPFQLGTSGKPFRGLVQSFFISSGCCWWCDFRLHTCSMKIQINVLFLHTWMSFFSLPMFNKVSETSTYWQWTWVVSFKIRQQLLGQLRIKRSPVLKLNAKTSNRKMVMQWNPMKPASQSKLLVSPVTG